MQRILLIGLERQVAETIKQTLPSRMNVEEMAHTELVHREKKPARFDLAFVHIDQILAAETRWAKDELKSHWQIIPSGYFIIVTPMSKIREAVHLVKAGADDYLILPIMPSELKLVTERLRELELRNAELHYLRKRLWGQDHASLLATSSPIMKKVFANIQSVSPTRSTVLLTGETGVGKSLFAKLIHSNSNRADGPFIAVHCGAIPETLLESELFGHEKGAFTGAIKRKLGRFELANRGTIFLDEIGTLPPSAQIKLLQVLQEGTFQRLGGEMEIKVDIRIISATNDNLAELTEAGTFRRDLFYRLNVFPLAIPPLRERAEDIPHLINHFIHKLNQSHGKAILGIEDRALSALQAYRWPGNIREMENLTERAYILEPANHLTLDSFPIEIVQKQEPQVLIDTSRPLAEARNLVLEQFEKRYLQEILTKTKGKINQAAAAAGIGVRQLHKLMAKHHLAKEDYKCAATSARE